MAAKGITPKQIKKWTAGGRSYEECKKLTALLKKNIRELKADRRDDAGVLFFGMVMNSDWEDGLLEEAARFWFKHAFPDLLKRQEAAERASKKTKRASEKKC